MSDTEKAGGDIEARLEEIEARAWAHEGMWAHRWHPQDQDAVDELLVAVRRLRLFAQEVAVFTRGQPGLAYLHQRATEELAPPAARPMR